ncbi:hypothetical protein D3C75_934960 [compost metagenome]
MRLLPVGGTPIIHPVPIDLVEVVHTTCVHPVHSLLAPARMNQYCIHRRGHIYIIRPDTPDRSHLYRTPAVVKSGEARDIPLRQNLIHHIGITEPALGPGGG